MALHHALAVLALLVAGCAAGGDGDSAAVLRLPTAADAGVATNAALAYTVFPTNGTLLAGQDLMQAERLYSPGGTVFLVPQTDGNLVLYNAHAVEQLGHTATEAALWASRTYNSGGPQPFDCNLVLYNGNAANGGPRNAGDAVFETATYDQGIAPCSLIVSDAGGGGFAVVDSTGTALFSTLRVLAVQRSPADYNPAEQTAFVYDPVPGTWSTVGPLDPASGPGPFFALARLPFGSALLAGGVKNTSATGSYQALDGAALVSGDPPAFQPTGALTTPRASFQLVTALNGQALALGGDTIVGTNPFGIDLSAVATGSIEAYNPNTGAWSPAGALLTPRTSHVSVVLHDGRVLTTGGITNAANRPVTASAEVFDPVLGESAAVADMSSPRVGHNMIVLADGTTLACGGTTNGLSSSRSTLFTCDLFDPSTGLWQLTGNMTNRKREAPFLAVGVPWSSFSLSLLPNGQVLASGVVITFSCIQLFDVYDPQTRTWSEIPASPASPLPNYFGPQALLPTGQVLLANSYASIQGCADANANVTGVITDFPTGSSLYNPLTQAEMPSGALPGASTTTTYLSMSVQF